MKTKKEEAIRKAYGEYWERMSPELQTIALHSDGWIQMRDCIKELGADFSLSQDLSTEPHFNSSKQRPKSLQGIENNNGWTIANLSDLPTEGIFNVGKFLNDGSFHQGYDDVEWYDLREYIVDFGFTHYQPIVKPEPPIY